MKSSLASIPQPPSARSVRPSIHPTAIIEAGVKIGAATQIWDCVHIRHSAQIGEQCIIGEKTYVAYGVSIGNRVKINAFVYICNNVTIEDGAMISAGVIFTNDRFPRATSSDLRRLRSSEPDEHTLSTLVCEGATIGARCTVGCSLSIGRFAMIGMGSVITTSVPDFALAFGNPARVAGYVCRCGNPLLRFSGKSPTKRAQFTCSDCRLLYKLTNSTLIEMSVPR